MNVWEWNEGTAIRKKIDNSFGEKLIKKITDKSIQKILLAHLKSEKYQNQTNDDGKKIAPKDAAFSQSGIEEMNSNITTLNGGKPHQPIYRVRVWEESDPSPLGKRGNKKKKHVKAAKGTNLYFAIYAGKNKNGKTVRKYRTMPLNEVIEQLKQGDNPVPQKHFDADNCEYDLLFWLSPSDLVYVPTDEETNNPEFVNFNNLSNEQLQRIYLFTDGSGTTANFVPCNVATTIFNLTHSKQKKVGLVYPIQNEFGLGSQGSKSPKTSDGEYTIKEYCWKLKTDRLGIIRKVLR